MSGKVRTNLAKMFEFLRVNGYSTNGVPTRDPNWHGPEISPLAYAFQNKLPHDTTAYIVAGYFALKGEQHAADTFKRDED